MAVSMVALLARGSLVSAEPVDATRTLSGLNSAQMFEIARRAEAGNGIEDAEAIYRALASDPSPDVRNEARFRHAQLLAKHNKRVQAAILYRAILDERPDAQRVRLELAALLAQMGDFTGARRQLRQAQTRSLPPEVAQIVNQYSAALRSFRPITASFEISLAPSNNINRATRSTILDTVIAPFQLSDEARAKSGTGIQLGGVIGMRLPISSRVALTGSVSGQGDLYRESAFNDIIAAAEFGPEWLAGKLRIQPLAGRSWRWFGNHPYSITDSGSLKLSRPLGLRAQIEMGLGIGYSNYKLNDLQDGATFNISLNYERAFSQRFGGGVSLGFDRQGARDAGYATRSGSLQLLAWREIRKISAFAVVNISRLGADQRLALFPLRRKDSVYRVTAGASFRQITIHGFSPIIRATYERSHSTVGLYDYARIGGNVGLTHAF